MLGIWNVEICVYPCAWFTTTFSSYYIWFCCSHILDIRHITSTFRGYPFKKMLFTQTLGLAKIHGKCMKEAVAVKIFETIFSQSISNFTWCYCVLSYTNLQYCVFVTESLPVLDWDLIHMIAVKKTFLFSQFFRLEVKMCQRWVVTTKHYIRWIISCIVWIKSSCHATSTENWLL